MLLRLILFTSALLLILHSSGIAQNEPLSSDASTAPALVVQAPTPLRAHAKHLTGLSLSADGKILVTASLDDTVKVWTLPERRLLATLKIPGEHLANFRLLPDGRGLIIAHGSQYGKWKIRIWSLPKAEILATVPDKAFSFALTPDGNILATTKYKEIRLWSLPDAKPLATIKPGRQIPEIGISPDGKLIASAWGREVKAWSLPDGTLLGKAKGGMWQGLAGFTPDSRILLTQGGRGKTEGVGLGAQSLRKELYVWSLPGLKLLSKLKLDKPIRFSLLAPDGKNVAVCTTDGKVRFWALSPVSLLDTLQGNPSNCALSFSADGEWLAFGSEQQTVKLYSLQEKRLLASMPTEQAMIRALMITPDKKLLISGGNDATLQVWKVPEGRRLANLSGHTGPPAMLAYLTQPDGRTLISGQSGGIETHGWSWGQFAGGLIGGGVIGGILVGQMDHNVMKERDGIIAVWDLDRLQFRDFLADPDLEKDNGRREN